mmetsp:Transcript_19486/g.52461  ORF Transcript_19486/g.52461 Transcript_19486/m.52461 type:complete len:467 (-) Transcript_19486:215-1615(-)|eukprot:CAMPEP_0185155600 /NCGR_PEP_ID=MMETSP1139-20130426/552_1 /TAXON_ID=298111 /ORGANISM="Pavlova sp., Strain CCMP459" /LENGTH=466 /DNA_ID=CAMNT_0027720513 /DNA_START=39 /DNA_END=1439 /DNA_ORIENTATION=-
MGACSSSRMRAAAKPADDMSVREAFDFLHGQEAKGLEGTYLFTVQGSSPPEQYLLESSAGVISVKNLADPNADVPAAKPTASVRYKSPEVFFADARGDLPKTAYMNGLATFSGNAKKAAKLDDAFQPLALELKSRQTSMNSSAASDEPLVTTNLAGLMAAPVAVVPWWHVHTKAWWKRHFGTDLLIGNWVTVLGTFLWLVTAVLPIIHKGGRGSGYEWATVVSASFFLLGFALLAELSYQDKLVAFLAELEASDAAKADVEQGPGAGKMSSSRDWWYERLVGTNPMSRGMAVMNWGGMGPFVVLGIAAFATHGILSIMGWGITLALLIFAPALVLMTESTTTEAMKDMATGGEGSRHFANWATKSKCNKLCCCCLSEEAFERHLGSDMKAGMWYFVALMVVFQLMVTPLVFMHPLDFMTQLNFWMTTCFTVGIGLQVRAQYPEYMNSSILFGDASDDASNGDGNTP